MPKPKPKRLKAHPSTINLPGGVRLQGLSFAVRELDAEGRPKLLELLPPGTPFGGVGRWTLWADEAAIRAPGQALAEDGSDEQR
jgi:hypothetical protein